jgi:hypothetical protein
VIALGDDAPKFAGFLGVGGDGFVFGAAPHPLARARGRPNGRSPALRAVVGFEVQIALDWESELAADSRQFHEAHIAELLGPVPGRRPAGPPKVCSKRLLPF